MGKYWEKRFLKDKAAAINVSERYLASEQKKYFRQASIEITGQIEKIYQSFADSEHITLAEAKRRIRQADFHKVNFEKLVSYQIDRNQKFRQKKDRLPADIVASIEKQHMVFENGLRALTRKGQITYLSMLQANIDKALIDLYDKNQISIYDFLTDEYESAYYKSMFHCQQAIGFGKDFTTLNRRAIDRAVVNSYRKSNYSKRLYAHCQNFTRDLKENLIVGMIRGENMDRMAARISKRLSVSASSARRLVRTETAYIYEQAAVAAYRECGIEQYEFLATLDLRTSPVCQELDGKVFYIKDAVPGKNYPPMHPNCRSTTVCHFDDDKVTERIAKDKNGKYYEVPSDMTYENWKEAAGKPELLLTGQEKHALNQYTGFQAYHINLKLRQSQETSREEKEMIDYLNKALDKFPDYKGDLCRELKFYNAEDKEMFFRDHKSGNIVKYNQFISASKVEGYHEEPDVRIYIQDSGHGKDITSFQDREKEVLYKSGSSFKVKEVIKKDDVTYILMEEHCGKD